MARGHTTNDYGTAVKGSGKLHKPLLLAVHALHWASSIIVLSIAAYFIHKFSHNTHLVYWLTIASIDALLFLPTLFLPALRTHKGYVAPLAWIFSYLWLTAFIFAAQDYNYGGGYRSPDGVGKHSIKKTLEAFAFLAFFTNLVGHFLEGRLWDLQRFKKSDRYHDKHIANEATAAVSSDRQEADAIV